MMTDSPNPIRRRFDRRGTVAAVAAGLLALGAGAGALAVEATRPSVSMAPATPVAIRSLSSSGIVTIRGRVAEIYGNKFVMADQTGRALVDTGRNGEDGQLVRANEAVTVQGRFDHGFIHAAFLVGPDGKVAALGPLEGPHGRHGHHGDDSDRGPGHDGPGRDGAGRDGPDEERTPPPPPVAAAASAPATTPANTAAPAA